MLSFSRSNPVTQPPAHWIPSHLLCFSQSPKTYCPSSLFSSTSPWHQNHFQDLNQSGFKPAHSTEIALIAVTEKLQSARSAKLSSVLILLDLSAAFDTVNHTILLDILTNLGITGYVWKWFKSYLEVVGMV
ncbi:hypothetical protein MHYP_G00055650 [Metynnis hypsauchen]